jgi:hypothetical protein
VSITPFGLMTAHLVNEAVLAQKISALQQPGTGPTDAMRALLRRGGRYRSRELAAAAGVASALVMPLLKNDLNAGRVLRVRGNDGRRLYQAAPEADLQLADDLRAAEKLLRRHGWRVQRPQP